MAAGSSWKNQNPASSVLAESARSLVSANDTTTGPHVAIEILLMYSPADPAVIGRLSGCQATVTE
jgi:hypothetical protein